MKAKFYFAKMIIFAIVLISAPMLITQSALAHCDTLEGPVVKDAKNALNKGEIAPVLKWVKKEHEAEVIAAFAKALIERVKTPDDKERADMEFFETVVRIHREGEGEPFNGIKPKGVDLAPAVVEADKSLEKGSAESLVKLVNDTVAKGLRQRFADALKKKKHKDESVEEGRAFVEAYVEFVHYAEQLYLDAAGNSAHRDKTPLSRPIDYR